MDAMLRLVLLKYKISHIPSMLELITSLVGWLGAAAHNPTLQAELAKTKEAVLEAKNSATMAEVNVKVLDTSLANHKKDFSRLTA